MSMFKVYFLSGTVLDLKEVILNRLHVISNLRDLTEKRKIKSSINPALTPGSSPCCSASPSLHQMSLPCLLMFHLPPWPSSEWEQVLEKGCTR